MATDFRAAFNQLADTFKQFASDAHKRRVDPLIRDVSYNARRGGRLILDAYKAGALPGFAAWYNAVYGNWKFDASESPEEHVWVLAISYWLYNEYKNRFPDNAHKVDSSQWKVRPGVKSIVREWADDDGTRYFESKLPDDALEFDGSMFGQFKLDDADSIERTYQRLTTYVAAAQLLAELVNQNTTKLDGKENTLTIVPSEDFTSVRWGNKTFDFSPGNQAKAMKVLFEEYRKGGKRLHESTIATKIGSGDTHFRMAHVFRSRSKIKPRGKNAKSRYTPYRPHPALGTMIVGNGDGCYRLVPPESTKNPAKHTD